MGFTIVGAVTGVEVTGRGRAIRRLRTLIKRYGGKNWRKMNRHHPNPELVDEVG
jgi:hypothetical protein